MGDAAPETRRSNKRVPVYPVIRSPAFLICGNLIMPLSLHQKSVARYPPPGNSVGVGKAIAPVWGQGNIVQDEPFKLPPTDAGSTIPVISPPMKQPFPLMLQTDPESGETGEPAANPPWANDLRQLYNAVVEEPLPDSFLDLLSKLDSKD
jgi:hypothetical protein